MGRNIFFFFFFNLTNLTPSGRSEHIYAYKHYMVQHPTVTSPIKNLGSYFLPHDIAKLGIDV